MFILIDTETTGLSNPDVIQFSILTLDSDFSIDRMIDEYCLTDRVIEQGAYRVHGISNESLLKLADKHIEYFVLEKYRDLFFGENNVFIAYNAQFDVRAIRGSVRDNTGLDVPFGVYIDKLSDAPKGKNCVFDIMKFTNKKMRDLGKYSRTGRFTLSNTIETFEKVHHRSCSEEFNELCEIIGVENKAGFHNSLYDTFCIYFLMDLFKDELLGN